MTSAHVWLAYDFNGHQWLANWIAGVGQAVGAIVTFAAVWVALGAERKADKRRRSEADDDEQRRLRMITLADSLEGDKTVAEVCIFNEGLEPIFLAGIEDIQPQEEDSTSLVVLHQGDVGHGKPFAGTIKPGEHAEFYVHCENTNGDHVEWPKGLKVITIQFKDAHGKAWRRVGHRTAPEQIEMTKWELERYGKPTKQPPRKGTKAWRRANRWWNPYREKPELSWWGWPKRFVARRWHKLDMWAFGWERRILLGEDMSKRRPPDY